MQAESAAPEPSLSVLVATHNGADTLERTLRAMSELSPPRGGWELVLVNNASSDRTAEIAAKWVDRLPMRYIFEPKLGKSFAMNAALEQARGRFVIMTDDDVLPQQDWLVEWERVAEDYPQLSLFGGAIVPYFEHAPPRWALTGPVLTVLYAKTPDQAEGEVEPVDISGGNMAVRRSVIEGGWRFGEGFMVGVLGLMGEDSDFVRRVAGGGARVGFAPTASIRHIINQGQLSWWWAQTRFFRHGRTMFVLEEVEWDAQTGRAQFTYPRWRLRRAVGRALKLAAAAATFRQEAVFLAARALAYDLGALRQAGMMVKARAQEPVA